MKIPTMDVELKLIPIGIACGVAVFLAQANISVIFTGGVGKNGSTVAVRKLLQYQPDHPYLYLVYRLFLKMYSK